MKNRSEEMQTLRASCSKADPKIFTPPQTPFPGAWDSHNLISWRWSLPLSTNPVWRGSMHAISSYCGNRPTKYTHKPTNRQDRLQYTVPRLARSVINADNVHLHQQTNTVLLTSYSRCIIRGGTRLSCKPHINNDGIVIFCTILRDGNCQNIPHT